MYIYLVSLITPYTQTLPNTTKHIMHTNTYTYTHKTLTVLLSTLEWAGVGGGGAVVIIFAVSVTCIIVIHCKRRVKKKNSSESMIQRYMYMTSL